MAPSRFGIEACNDSGFVFGLRDGRNPGLRTVERVEAYMAAKEAEAALNAAPVERPEAVPRV